MEDISAALELMSDPARDSAHGSFGLEDGHEFHHDFCES